MLKGFYAGVSGIYYNGQKLSATANNLANAYTKGYRKERLMMSARQENEEARFLKSKVKKSEPPTFGIQRGGVFKDFSTTGSITATDNPLDIAIPSEISNGFLAVKPEGGKEGDVAYTRNGSLSLGQLDPNDANSPIILKASGHALLDAALQPIQIDTNRGPLSIAEDGAIYQGEERVADLAVWSLQQQDPQLGKIAMNLQQLLPMGTSMFQIPPGLKDTAVPEQIQLGVGGVTSLVKQGTIEESNVNLYSEMIEMIEATKNAEANVYSLRRQVGSLTKLFETVRR